MMSAHHLVQHCNKIRNSFYFFDFRSEVARRVFFAVSLGFLTLSSKHTFAALQSPSLVAPPNGASVAYVGANPCFQWGQTPDATSYNVTVSLSGNFPAQRWQKAF